MVPSALSVAERLVSGVVVVDPVEPGGGGLGWGIVTGNRGVWSTAKPGVHPNSGKSPPYPLMRNCWVMLKVVVVKLE